LLCASESYGLDESLLVNFGTEAMAKLMLSRPCQGLVKAYYQHALRDRVISYTELDKAYETCLNEIWLI